ncbi:MAG: hypothetical protein ACI81T_003248 [Bacteroidia bacterium]|jgi:hypothetical protein
MNNYCLLLSLLLCCILVSCENSEEVINQEHEIYLKFESNEKSRSNIVEKISFIKDTDNTLKGIETDLSLLSTTDIDGNHGIFFKLDEKIAIDSPNSRESTPGFKIERGWFYSHNTGCFYYGTLITGNNGVSHFTPATNTLSIGFEPRCTYA